MKLPPLIWRLALDLPHLGQVSMGLSEIFWISSHWFAQSVQTYSYVGMCFQGPQWPSVRVKSRGGCLLSEENAQVARPRRAPTRAPGAPANAQLRVFT